MTGCEIPVFFFNFSVLIRFVRLDRSGGCRE